MACPQQQGWVLGSFLLCVDAVVEVAMQTRRVIQANWKLRRYLR